MTELTILHLSDTHVSAEGALHFGVTDTLGALDRVLAAAERLGPVQLLVHSGDISEDGSADSYRLVFERLRAWAERHGSLLVTAPGNHDPAETYRAALTPDAAPALPGSSCSVHRLGEHRVISLDTSVPARGHGLLGADQLRWLSAELARAEAPAGSILVLHHPPVSGETPLPEALGLQDREAFWQAVEGGDVRLILTGHTHLAMVELHRGVPVVIAPAITNQGDLFAPEGVEAAWEGAGAALIRMRSDGGLRVVPVMVPGTERREVYRLDEEQIRTIASLYGPPAP